MSATLRANRKDFNREGREGRAAEFAKKFKTEPLAVSGVADRQEESFAGRNVTFHLIFTRAC
jgi:hypothetical protein